MDLTKLQTELDIAEAEHLARQAERQAVIDERFALQERIDVYGRSGAEPRLDGSGPYLGKFPGDPVGLDLAAQLRASSKRLADAEDAVTEARRRRNAAERDLDAARAAIRRAAKAPTIAAERDRREKAKVGAARALEARRQAIAAELGGSVGARLSGLGSRLVGRS